MDSEGSSCECVCTGTRDRVLLDECQVDVLCAGSRGPFVVLGDRFSTVVGPQVGGIAMDWPSRGGWNTTNSDVGSLLFTLKDRE